MIKARLFLRISESIPKLAPVLPGKEHPAVLSSSWDRLGMPALLFALPWEGQEGPPRGVEAVQERQLVPKN